ncbi:MAG: metallophosphoesterase [Oscillospiraceae bacterium]|nr:metallophosphoesterase [Oscillospiraceae bacterium]MBQ4642650.1 metallophosphoesterase [Oscillospiraceae bacterium]
MKKLVSVILAIIMLLSFCGCSQKEPPLKIVTITDTHFTGSEYFDYEGIFASANDSNGSGKQVKYINEIFDAFIDQMLSEKPDYIIITGDIAFDGAKVSHLQFSEKLKVLSEAGIKVLVLPGNHDITGYAFIFPDGEPKTVESVTPEEFREIYSEFGYTDGISYDEGSLSYVYDTGKGVRIFMLDTNLQYGAALGKIRNGTFEWLEKELSACSEAGDFPVVAGHHSLLSHNPRFDFNYKLSNGTAVSELISEYGGNLYLCGHLHTQHFVRTETFTDIVGGGFCVYPHRYGVIEISGDGWKYESKTTDVSAYAEKIGSTDENLLGYSDYGYGFFYSNAYAQASETIYSVVEDPELAEKYSVFSAQLNVAYFSGVFSDLDLSFAEEFIAATEGTGWSSYMSTVLLDTKDNVFCQWPAENE